MNEYRLARLGLWICFFGSLIISWLIPSEDTLAWGTMYLVATMSLLAIMHTDKIEKENQNETKQ